jgi:hypothetical protein
MVLPASEESGKAPARLRVHGMAWHMHTPTEGSVGGELHGMALAWRGVAGELNHPLRYVRLF